MNKYLNDTEKITQKEKFVLKSPWIKISGCMLFLTIRTWASEYVTEKNITICSGNDPEENAKEPAKATTTTNTSPTNTPATPSNVTPTTTTSSPTTPIVNRPSAVIVWSKHEIIFFL